MEGNSVEQQFLELVKIIEGMQKKIASLEQINQTLVRSNNQLIQWIDDSQEEQQDFQRNIFYELHDPQNMMRAGWYPTIVSAEKTIEKIVRERKSLARFGDGEFSAIAGRIRHKFQTEVDEGLGERLTEVLKSENDDLLIGIANNYGSLERYTEQAKREIRRYLNPEVRKEHLRLLNSQKIYYDAYVTRPYVMFADNQTNAPAERFRQIRTIWEKKDCILVEGCFTRMGFGNDLFDNANTIQRILGPAENAFSQYESIFDFCVKQKKDTLFLLSLGPTATVLAYDLCREGYQAIDVGHIDLEYEWFLRGEGCRTHIEGKYNNEMYEEKQILPLKDKKYLCQVIADFSDGQYK